MSFCEEMLGDVFWVERLRYFSHPLTRLNDFFWGEVEGFFLRLHDFCCIEVV